LLKGNTHKNMGPNFIKKKKKFEEASSRQVQVVISFSLHNISEVYHLFLHCISVILICIFIHLIHLIVQLLQLVSMFRVQTVPEPDCSSWALSYNGCKFRQCPSPTFPFGHFQAILVDANV
jgi:hypothetical protein